jgi:hypothetical protein
MEGDVISAVLVIVSAHDSVEHEDNWKFSGLRYVLDKLKWKDIALIVNHCNEKDVDDSFIQSWLEHVNQKAHLDGKLTRFYKFSKDHLSNEDIADFIDQANEKRVLFQDKYEGEIWNSEHRRELKARMLEHEEEMKQERKKYIEDMKRLEEDIRQHKKQLEEDMR